MTDYTLAQAAYDNDDIADRDGYQAAISDLALSEDDLQYVAQQRALRAVLVQSGRADELREIHALGELATVDLSTDEQERLKALIPVYLDGICIGVRYAQ